MATFFRPLEGFIDFLIRDRDYKKRFQHNGNFAPVSKENSIPLLEFTGQIPTDLTGVFLKNTPNPRFIPSNNLSHWFDGDSMVHAFRFKNGQLFYCNRYLQTPKLMYEIEQGGA